jgi:hypothetical protein
VNIENFSQFRAGSGWPNVVDVVTTYQHESSGVHAMVCTAYRPNERVIELRQSQDGFYVALFSDVRPDMELDVYWRESTVLWRRVIPANGKEESPAHE